MASILSKTPMLSKLRALELAQQAIKLEPGRRRSPKFWSEVSKKLDPLLEQARERLRADAQAAAALEAEKAKEPTYPPEVLRAIELARKFDAWVELTAELAQPLLGKVLSSSNVRDEVRRLLAGHPAAKPAVPDVFSTSFSALDSGPRKPKVLVAGLLPAQANEISSEFDKLVELRFWHTDESKDKLRTLAKNCNLAVGVTNFLSHPADASLQSLAPTYVRHTGGITRLKDTIREALPPAAPLPH